MLYPTNCFNRFTILFCIVLVLSVKIFADKSNDNITNQNEVGTTPTAKEVTDQIERANKLDSTKNQIDQSESQLIVYSNNVNILQAKVDELRDSISRNNNNNNQRLLGMINTQNQEIAKLQAEIDTINTKKQIDVTNLKSQTLVEWATSVDTWYKGLQFGQTLMSIHSNTIIFPENEDNIGNTIVSIIGQIATLAGSGILTYQSANDKNINFSGPTFIGVGLSTYFITSGIKNMKKDSNKQDLIRLYVERIAQHKTFNSELAALSDGVAAVCSTMTGYVKIASSLRMSREYEKFILTKEIISKYRNTIESYNTIISLLSRTNSLSKQLIQDDWNDTIKDRLKDIDNKTRIAILNWRSEIILAERLIINMEKVADAEK